MPPPERCLTAVPLETCKIPPSAPFLTFPPTKYSGLFQTRSGLHCTPGFRPVGCFLPSLFSLPRHLFLQRARYLGQIQAEKVALTQGTEFALDFLGRFSPNRTPPLFSSSPFLWVEPRLDTTRQPGGPLRLSCFVLTLPQLIPPPPPFPHAVIQKFLPG